MEKTSLKISLSPRDHRLLPAMLNHQVSFWHKQFDEILLVLDFHGYDTDEFKEAINAILSLIENLQKKYHNVRLIYVDYSKEAKKLVSAEYFAGKEIPEKTHRYGPFYSYYYGIYHTAHDYVFSIDSDIIFGGMNENWVREAIEILEDKSIFTCSPLPGYPTPNGELRRQAGKIDNSELRKVIFTHMSTRLFFFSKKTFKSQICPLPIKFAKWQLSIRALLRSVPPYELPEDTISKIMLKKGLKRIDFLGTGEGIWTLHPPYRNEEFYEKLDQILDDVKNNKIPEEQKGDYDINNSMVNWEGERQKIRDSSMKRKLLKKLRLIN
jgi:hypothetical protein